jgi:glutathione S-transferase
MKIYDSPFSPSCRKVRAVAFELDLDLEYLPINLFRGEQQTPAFLEVNPNALVPVLVDGDFVLWESNAIVAYLAHGTRLLPVGPRERAEVDRWSAWQLAHLGPPVWKVAFERYLKPRVGKGDADDAVVAAGTAEFQKQTGILETSIGNREYVAGKLSVADFVLAPIFALGGMVGLETAPFPRVDAWLKRLLARPSMARAMADGGATSL